jgi:hypothetical protein
LPHSHFVMTTRNRRGGVDQRFSLMNTAGPKPKQH